MKHIELFESFQGYCVYIYLDPRKPGNYKYDDLEFDHEPIYVGKGNNNRPKRHMWLYTRHSTRFYSKIKAIKNDGLEPIIKVYVCNLSEVESFKLESEIIKKIGRIENDGPLTNLSDGGEGQSGYKFSEEGKLKMSQSRLGKKIGPMSDEAKRNISLSKIGKESPMKGKEMSQESKDRMRVSALNRSMSGENNPMYNRKHDRESIEMMSKNRIKKFGSDNPNYGRKYTEEEKTFDTWKLTNSEGVTSVINNLNKFCQDNNLNPSCMRDIYYGRMKNHKGWISVEKLSDNVKKKKS